MKYVVYFSDSKGNKDSLIANSRKNFLREVKALSDEGFIVTEACRVVRGEYVPFFIKNKFILEVLINENQSWFFRFWFFRW